ncbi:MAG: hypothetical protein P1U88_00005 [Thalassobaculaceae bacterium]|nr:hypothetical protein [Thalassobaculaceae bacterium]
MSDDLGKAARERLERLRIDQRFRLGRTALRCGAVVGVAWLLGDAVKQFAGEETSIFVSAFFSLVADIKFAVAVTLAGGAAGWAMVERWLRHRKVDQLQGRVRDLELDIDPRRSTSGLTTKGKTNPSDKD